MEIEGGGSIDYEPADAQARTDRRTRFFLQIRGWFLLKPWDSGPRPPWTRGGLMTRLHICLPFSWLSDPPPLRLLNACSWCLAKAFITRS